MTGGNDERWARCERLYERPTAGPTRLGLRWALGVAACLAAWFILGCELLYAGKGFIDGTLPLFR